MEWGQECGKSMDLVSVGAVWMNCTYIFFYLFTFNQFVYIYLQISLFHYEWYELTLTEWLAKAGASVAVGWIGWVKVFQAVVKRIIFTIPDTILVYQMDSNGVTMCHLTYWWLTYMTDIIPNGQKYKIIRRFLSIDHHGPRWGMVLLCVRPIIIIITIYICSKQLFYNHHSITP